jgi:hypothetical protein
LAGLAIEDVGIFYGHMVPIFYGHLPDFMAFWYIFWLFGIFFPVLLCCSKNNLAALNDTTTSPKYTTHTLLTRGPFSPRFLIQEGSERNVCMYM